MCEVLVRNGQHQRPMLAVLRRYGIGEADRYSRGIWIHKEDLSDILERMQSDRSFFMHGDEYVVNGSSKHNQVMFSDFEKLFPDE